MSQEIYPEDYCWKIISNCPSSEGCSVNVCPLDPNYWLRTNPEKRVCKWMREAKEIALKGEKQGIQFVSGGKVMPDYLLKLIPENVAQKLNRVSFERWRQIYDN